MSGSGEPRSQLLDEGVVMKKRNPRLGSTFESWLEEEGIREEVTAAAVKAVLAAQLAAEMKRKRMAELMK